MPNYMVRNHFKIFSYWTSINTLSTRSSNLKMAMSNIRWAFKVSEWNHRLDEITAASSYIQPEERERISKFYFQNDAKSSLIGRLLLRKYIHISTCTPYEEIQLTRDDRGKPYLVGAKDMPLSFNVSHQGDFVVFAGDTQRNIGIDVMKIEPPVNKNIPEFFRLMRRQFSDHEWSTIRSFPTELEQVACFYRIWCLKESYVKNLGDGITVPLDEISFSIKTRKLEVGNLVMDTLLYTHNVLQKDWVFEETLLNELYTVAVAVKIADKANHTPTPYTFLNFVELVKEAKALCEPDVEFSAHFMEKAIKSF